MLLEENAKLEPQLMNPQKPPHAGVFAVKEFKMGKELRKEQPNKEKSSRTSNVKGNSDNREEQLITAEQILHNLVTPPEVMNLPELRTPTKGKKGENEEKKGVSFIGRYTPLRGMSPNPLMACDDDDDDNDGTKEQQKRYPSQTQSQPPLPSSSEFVRQESPQRTTATPKRSGSTGPIEYPYDEIGGSDKPVQKEGRLGTPVGYNAQSLMKKKENRQKLIKNGLKSESKTVIRKPPIPTSKSTKPPIPSFSIEPVVTPTTSFPQLDLGLLRSESHLPGKGALYWDVGKEEEMMEPAEEITSSKKIPIFAVGLCKQNLHFDLKYLDSNGMRVTPGAGSKERRSTMFKKSSSRPPGPVSLPSSSSSSSTTTSFSSDIPCSVVSSCYLEIEKKGFSIIVDKEKKLLVSWVLVKYVEYLENEADLLLNISMKEKLTKGPLSTPSKQQRTTQPSTTTIIDNIHKNFYDFFAGSPIKKDKNDKSDSMSVDSESGRGWKGGLHDTDPSVTNKPLINAISLSSSTPSSMTMIGVLNIHLLNGYHITLHLPNVVHCFTIIHSWLMYKIQDRVRFLRAFIDLVEKKVISKGINVNLRDFDEIVDTYNPFIEDDEIYDDD
jgi:hypothetical protein